MGNAVRTVTGDVDPSELGPTLMHEHLIAQLWVAAGRFDDAILPRDLDMIARELGHFATAGGRTVVELTTDGFGRDPEALAQLASRTGIQVVMGCGWYRGAYYPPADEVDRRMASELADKLIAEIESGVGRTGIRPGVIGQLGVDKSWTSPEEERVHRAAARAAVATGLGIITYSPLSPVGLDQLTILDEEGVDLRRVAIGHADSHRDWKYYTEVLSTGATLLFDGVGTRLVPLEDELAGIVAQLCEQGHVGQIMLSHGINRAQHWTRLGGCGYAHVLTSFAERLRARGLDGQALTTLLEANPARLLAVAR